MHYALLYTVVDDYLERRGEFRAEHLGIAKAAHERSELVMAGAFAEPADGALLVFRAEDASVVEAFAQSDPYVVNGLVTDYRIRPWTVVIGAE
ncbi:MAG TPA: YciI-like protein [Mycobacteriales bacterium]|nr:YciI-like protein [Mycobacteriales bacterium]